MWTDHVDRPSGFCDSQLTKTPRAKYYFYNTSCIFPNFGTFFTQVVLFTQRCLFAQQVVYFGSK